MKARIMSKSQNLHTPVYEGLKSQIINLTLKPGQKLQDRQLALQLGVSRTPVREALNRLVQEGFVRQIPGQGYFVKEITIKEIEDLYEVRKALEVLAVQQTIRNISNRQIKKLSEILKSHNTLIYSDEFKSRLLEGADFHKTIAFISGNQYLYEIISNIFDRISTFRGIGSLTLERRKIVYQQHREIYNLLKEKDATRLKNKLRKHISEAKREAVEEVKKKTGLLYLGYHS
ncbi:MAG: GntR family transcriptional regulator [Candidatus Hodarchaeota archaeon]